MSIKGSLLRAQVGSQVILRVPGWLSGVQSQFWLVLKFSKFVVLNEMLKAKRPKKTKNPTAT